MLKRPVGDGLATELGRSHKVRTALQTGTLSEKKLAP
jgi:hypothetical protein